MIIGCYILEFNSNFFAWIMRLYFVKPDSINTFSRSSLKLKNDLSIDALLEVLSDPLSEKTTSRCEILLNEEY